MYIAIKYNQKWLILQRHQSRAAHEFRILWGIHSLLDACFWFDRERRIQQERREGEGEHGFRGDGCFV